eukprot:CAMPEP_0206020078 /NCGR_PEP_ID=MMETSP1464-20131121/30330_1 /ASSEMBLY_ACC=CAM_ASM_001124 /TAXON_ID=119497 /ORGANISM="Exanthemachrysis gayraliae, Strain RCC1523" /LENGTH=220 /DNA_ID=CAMNT_0053393999 /DNA_START=179 /DNA_END=837 /DNA_ORIENTATION=+
MPSMLAERYARSRVVRAVPAAAPPSFGFVSTATMPDSSMGSVAASGCAPRWCSLPLGGLCPGPSSESSPPPASSARGPLRFLLFLRCSSPALAALVFCALPACGSSAGAVGAPSAAEAACLLGPLGVTCLSGAAVGLPSAAEASCPLGALGDACLPRGCPPFSPSRTLPACPPSGATLPVPSSAPSASLSNLILRASFCLRTLVPSTTRSCGSMAITRGV